MASTLGVTRRTLRNWMRAVETPPRKVGRPSHPIELKRACLCAVRRVMRLEGGVIGGASMWRLLGGRYPLRVVRECVKAWKARDKARRQHRIVVRRLSVDAEVRDAVWSLDGAQVGRGGAGGSHHVELVRELKTLGYASMEVRGPSHGWDVIAVLERMRVERGCLPLVLATDNGPENCNAVVSAYLARHQVVHLRNLPRVPQHNSWAERGVQEVKEAAGCHAGELCNPGELEARINAAVRRLNARPRPSRGWKSADEMTAAEPPAEALVDRGCFSAAARSAVEEAVRDLEDGRARRMAERAAILQTLVNFQLIRCTRGGTPLEAS